MRTAGVPWRRVALGFGVAGLVSAAVVVAVRSDGFHAVDATVPRATRWFVDRAAGRAVLADGFAGRTLVRLDVAEPDQPIAVVQAAGGVVVIDRSAATAQPIDAAALQVGSVQSLPVVAEREAIVGVGQPGIVAVDPLAEEGVLVPPDGEQQAFSLQGAAGTGRQTRIAPDGAVWTIGGGEFARITTQGRESYAVDVAAGRSTLVGNVGMLLDTAAGRVRLGHGSWVDLPDGVDPSEAQLQEPGPSAQCGWIGFGDRLWCVSGDGVTRTAEVTGLGVGGGDLLAIAGDAAALVDQARGTITRFDWRDGRIISAGAADVPPGAQLQVWSTVDLVWVDDTAGDTVWAIHPWGINPILKDDPSSPRLGEDGGMVDAGEPGDAPGVPGDGTADAIDRQPDNNGIDDPPQAFDDSVTARTGASVPVQVTANDFDPDGEAVAVWSVDDGAHGTVTIASASTVLFQPEAGFVGTDTFQYTITDQGGQTATATVALTLLAVDAPNSAPVGVPDRAQTAQDVAVDIDVLLNDIDPERDAIRLGSFEPSSNIGGVVTESIAPSGLPALRFEPPTGRYGTATFTYRPMDSLGAEGEPVAVTVEVWPASEGNHPPEVKPDAVRLRRNVETAVAVLANDSDPDGDQLTLTIVDTSLPPGVDVRLDGNQLQVTARGGAAQLTEFHYEVSDGSGATAIGQVLVVVVGDDEPNRPPIANADTASAVAGTPVMIDVLGNDTDPDGDPLVLVDVTVVADTGVASGGNSTARVQDNAVYYVSGPLAADDDAVTDQLRYTITDGHGHMVSGTVAVRLLPERIEAPPFAQNDAVTTFVNQPVKIDVLRNDFDPSGEKPQLVGAPGCPAGGSAQVGADSQVTFTPEPGQAKVYRCSYTVRNSLGLTASATITISVIPPPIDNLAPVVPDRTVPVTVGQSIPIDLLEGVTDPDDPVSSLRVVSTSVPRVGTAVRNGSILTYRAPATTDVVVIQFEIGDPHGAVDGGQILIRIVPPDPVPPQTQPDAYTIRAPETIYEMDVVSNDWDPDGTNAELQLRGTVRVLEGDGNVTTGGGRIVRFAAVPGFYGSIVAEYTIEDADGLPATGRATLTVLPPENLPPVANDDGFTIPYGGSVDADLGGNDGDPENQQLTYRIVSGPDAALGTATLAANGQFRFEARAGATGTAVVRYEVTDTGGLTDQADVRIAIQPCAASQPVANSHAYKTGYMEPISIDLNQHASNGTIVEVGPPLGQASGVYTPPAGFNDTVEFTYVVVNACGTRAVGTITIDVNQAPNVRPYSMSMARTATAEIALAAMADDKEAISFTALTGAPSWVTIASGGQSLRLAPAGASGTVTFSARVTDAGGLSAEAPITVNLTNGAPTTPAVVEIAVPYRGVVTAAVPASDPDGDGLTLTVQEPPSGSGFVIVVNRLDVTVDATAVTTPSTTIELPYQVADPFGQPAAGVLRVTVGAAPPTTTTTTSTTTTTTTTVAPTTTTTVPPTTTTTTTTTTSTSTTTSTTTTTVPDCVEYPPPWPNPFDPNGEWPPDGVPWPPFPGGQWCS